MTSVHLVCCSVDGCEGYVYGLGLCNKHYMREYRARTGNHNTKVTNAASRASAKWVRNNRPVLWQTFLDEARKANENPAAVGSGYRYDRVAT